MRFILNPIFLYIISHISTDWCLHSAVVKGEIDIATKEGMESFIEMQGKFEHFSSDCHALLAFVGNYARTKIKNKNSYLS